MSEEKEQKKEEVSEDHLEKDSSEILKKRERMPPSDKLKKKRHLLSFDQELDDHDEEKIIKAKNTMKKKLQLGRSTNKESLEKDLKRQYLETTDKLKEQLFEFEYSYWEGANIVKKLRRKKKAKIKELLEVIRLELIQNFQNLAQLEPSELLFVIKDFIVPQEMAIHEIQALQLKTAKGENLLSFRDVKIKKDGKQLTLSVNIDGPIRIIERNKYEKNKTVFPFLNWRTMNI